MRVVLDTNVIISAFLWAGTTNEILDLITDKKITIYTCPEQVIELKNVLERPKFKTIFKKAGLTPIMVVFEFSNLAKFVKSTKVINVIKEDPFDNIILSTALESNARYLITGDNHLLSLKKFQDIQILKVREFLEQHKNLSNSTS